MDTKHRQLSELGSENSPSSPYPPYEMYSPGDTMFPGRGLNELECPLPELETPSTQNTGDFSPTTVTDAAMEDDLPSGYTHTMLHADPLVSLSPSSLGHADPFSTDPGSVHESYQSFSPSLKNSSYDRHHQLLRCAQPLSVDRSEFEDLPTMSFARESTAISPTSQGLPTSPPSGCEEQRRDLHNVIVDGSQLHAPGIPAQGCRELPSLRGAINTANHSGDVSPTKNDLHGESAAVTYISSLPLDEHHHLQLDFQTVSPGQEAFFLPEISSPNDISGQLDSLSYSPSTTMMPTQTIHAHDHMQQAGMLNHSGIQTPAQNFAPEYAHPAPMFSTIDMPGNNPHLGSGGALHAGHGANDWAVDGLGTSVAYPLYHHNPGSFITPVSAFGTMSPPSTSQSFGMQSSASYGDFAQRATYPTDPEYDQEQMDTPDQYAHHLDDHFMTDLEDSERQQRCSIPTQASRRAKRSSLSLICHEEEKLKLTSTCETCETVFSGKYHRANLLRHRRTIHSTTPKTFSCSQQDCDLFYKRADALKHHEWKKHRLQRARPNKRRERVSGIPAVYGA